MSPSDSLRLRGVGLKPKGPDSERRYSAQVGFIINMTLFCIDLVQVCHRCLPSLRRVTQLGQCPYKRSVCRNLRSKLDACIVLLHRPCALCHLGRCRRIQAEMQCVKVLPFQLSMLFELANPESNLKSNCRLLFSPWECCTYFQSDLKMSDSPHSSGCRDSPLPLCQSLAPCRDMLTNTTHHFPWKLHSLSIDKCPS